MRNRIPGNITLEIQGLKAETIIDDRVWMFKTHFPLASMDQPGNEVQLANKVICCVRNPLDSIASTVHIFFNDTHSHSFKNDFLHEFPEFWDLFISSMIKGYEASVKYFLEAAREKRIPTFFFRFEDLLSEPYPVFKSMFEFLLGIENLEGTFIDHRIKKVIEAQAKPVYKPRQGGINKNLSLYSET